MRTTKHDSITGITIALGIILTWGAHLAYTLRLDAFAIHPLETAFHLLLQTFLCTGLFITAHDAMHGTVARHYRRVNGIIGGLAVRLYALFSYKKLWYKHWEHHRHVATPEADPDFHDGEHTGFVRWYANFLMNYIGWKQLVGMALVFNVLHHALHIPLQTLLLFWVAPSLLSTVQLFYFGTYLPHREPESGYTNRHRSASNNFSTLVSFLTCYHFGYHYEHHDSPATPWWKLPVVHTEHLQSAKSAGNE
jgi:beta-carotene/zeaxanthin 4-ketolase